MDGVGHATETEMNSDPACSGSNVNHVTTTYNGLGRVYKVENPNCSTNDTTYGLTTYTYDALGRPTTEVISGTTYHAILLQDNNYTDISNGVSGPANTYCTQTTGPASRGRKTCVDGLGRLTTVYEDPSGLDYTTTYTYDGLDNLLTVTQGSSQTPCLAGSTHVSRSFNYDSLSRLKSACNPESGTVSYTSYDGNGNLLTRVPPSRTKRARRLSLLPILTTR